MSKACASRYAHLEISISPNDLGLRFWSSIHFGHRHKVGTPRYFDNTTRGTYALDQSAVNLVGETTSGTDSLRGENKETNNAMKEDSNNLQDFLTKYSLDDLAKAFFALNIWLPNIASPIKLQFLYVTLEAIHDDLATENKLTSYAEFERFCGELFHLLPSLATLEDYVPEADWGDIKYYFNERFYRIFYGGDLSNPYDFYYAFEITHRAFEKHYVDLIHRSAVREMRFCLEAQNHLLENLSHEKSAAIDDISPGDITVPSEGFWSGVVEFLDGFQPESIFRNDILARRFATADGSRGSLA